MSTNSATQNNNDNVSFAATADSGKEEGKEMPIMSHAARRKAKKPNIVVTSQMKEEARERRRELRKHLRMLKSNGARRKVAKLRAEKRERETTNEEEACAYFDLDARPLKKGRHE